VTEWLCEQGLFVVPYRRKVVEIVVG